MPSLSTVAPDFKTDFDKFVSGQKALMYKSFSSKITREELATSIALMGKLYPIILNDKSLTQQQREEALSFVVAWKEWAGGLATKQEIKPPNEKALLAIAPDAKGADARMLSLYRNYLSVLDKCGTYSDGRKFVSPQKAEAMADFMSQLSGTSVMNFYQLRLLVAGMVETAVGQSPPDGWIFKFASQKDASDFANILSSLPGFAARDVRVSQGSGACTVTFSLSETDKEAFTLPQDALRTGKSKYSAMKDGVVQKAATSQVTIAGQSTSVPYITSKAEVLASATDNPSSYMSVSIKQAVSAALLYGEGYETDERDSYFFALLRAKAMISDLARNFGFTISEPLEDWIVSKQEGGGQAFLAKLNAAGITLDVVGSADMAVFYDGKNTAAWAAAADKNLLLAQKRSGLVIKYLTSLNSTVLANSENKLKFSNAPQGRLHFFQDFTAEGAKALGIPKYGYADGDGAKNMAALVAYLKTASAQDYIKVGQNRFSFTSEEQADAKKFHEKLSKIINADGTLKEGAVPLLNTYFRRMSDDPSLKGPGIAGGMIYEGKTSPKGREQFIPPNVFARAIMESTEVSSRSVSLSSEVKAQLSISVKAEDGKAVPTVAYTINSVPVAFNDQNGTVETYFENNRAMGVARTLDGSVNSGFAWQSVEVKKPVFQIERYTFGGEVSSQYPGRYLPLPFQSYSLTKQGPDEESTAITRKPINSMLCFGVRTTDKKLNCAPKYLIYPGAVEVKKEAPTYKIGNEYVVVDRDLYYRGDKFGDTKKYELYKKQADLVSLAQKGVVAIFVVPEAGQGVWVKLDGSLVDKKTLDQLFELGANEDAGEFLYGPKTFAQKTVVSFLNNQNYAIRADAPKSGEVPNIVANKGDKYQSSHLPNAMVVESKKDAWLARQHIIAKVEVDPSNPGKANVARLDGKSLGALDISLAERPDLAGKNRFEKKDLTMKWEQANETKMNSQIGLLAGGLFLFKPREEKEEFIQLTYIPRTKNIARVMGYIYGAED